MPRNPGTGVYEQPSPDVITATTIESAVYNGFVNDVETDLNLPRPIVAGGTGATDAAGARDNLDAERAMATVTNYDTQIWESGSFWSAAGATAAPVGGRTFVGTSIVGNNDQSFIDLHVTTLDVNTPKLFYMRQKVGGTWGAWIKEIPATTTGSGEGIAAVAGDMWFGVVGTTPGAAFVINTKADLTGDNVFVTSETGLTSVRTSNGDGGMYFNKSASGKTNDLHGQTNGVDRWVLNIGNATAEAGGNVGSDFTLRSFDNAGAFLATPVSIARSSGVVTLAAGVTTSVDLGSKVVTASGSARFQAQSTGLRSYSFGCLGTGAFGIYDDTAAAVRVSIETTGQFNAAGVIHSDYGYRSKQGQLGTVNPVDVFNYYWSGALQAWINATNVGNVTLTSDYRVKKDVADLPGTWDTVKALRPIRYTQARYTPQIEIARMAKEALAAKEQAVKDGIEPLPAVEPKPMFEADDIERWGFIAHELQGTLINSAATGAKDDPVHVQSPNPWTVIAALTRALQEAMARIEALEAAAPP